MTTRSGAVMAALVVDKLNLNVKLMEKEVKDLLDFGTSKRDPFLYRDG